MSELVNTNSTVKEIPGFYYDEEKKKYFRITKDHPKPPKKTESAENIKTEETVVKQCHVPQCKIIRNREIEATSIEQFKRNMKKSSIGCLNLRNIRGVKLNLEESILASCTSEITKIAHGAKQSILAIVSKVKGFDMNVVQTYDYKLNESRDLELKTPKDITIDRIADTIFSGNAQGKANKLLISSRNDHHGLSQAHVLWIDDHFVTIDRRIKLKSGQDIWSSCFIESPFTDRRFALGLTNGILMVGPVNRREKHPLVQTSRSDVLSLDCGKETQYLYSGSRDGYIRSIDLRGFHIVASTRAKKSIDSIKLLRNETHFIVSTMAGHLELWDNRMWRPILSYLGHRNSHSMLSLHVDNNEDFVASAGEDCVARIWDIRTAEKVKEVPNYQQSETEDPVRPAILFLDQVSGENMSSGFLYGIEDQLFYCNL